MVHIKKKNTKKKENIVSSSFGESDWNGREHNVSHEIVVLSSSTFGKINNNIIQDSKKPICD